MGSIASLNTSLTTVYSTVHSGAHQRKHQSSASLAFVRGIYRRPVDSPHKWPVTRKMCPFDDVIIFTHFRRGYFRLAVDNQPLPKPHQTQKSTDICIIFAVHSVWWLIKFLAATLLVREVTNIQVTMASNYGTMLISFHILYGMVINVSCYLSWRTT